MSKLKRGNNKYLVVIVVILGILGLISAIFILNNQNKTESIASKKQKALEPVPTFITQHSASTPTPKLPANVKEFKSSELGISFKYDNKVTVKQIDNKVYLYEKNIPNLTEEKYMEGGQTIEIFQKQDSESLSKAIEKRFLQGISKETCFVEKLENSSGFSGQENVYPTTYERVIISYPENTDPNGWVYENEKNCPKNYSKTNGISYFLGDSLHPTKFVYVSVGQYGISSGKENENWQSTIRFIDK